MEETIDVLMPTYNGEKYIREQIDSILHQTYSQIRLLISDDCSSDHTVEILKEYQTKDSRIMIFEQKENLGVSGNIEFLLKQVKSEFYMFSDQDDVWQSIKIEKSFEKLKRENADLVFGDLEVVDKELKPIQKSFNEFMLLNRKIEKYLHTNRLNYLYNCVTGCTILSKKEWIPKILPIPKNTKYVLHDHWIGLITSFGGKIAYLPERYIQYRQHGSNEVGAQKITHSMTSMQEIRQWMIAVKLGVFEIYYQNNSVFPIELQELNKQALDYFKMLQKVKMANFKNWKVFHQLYCTEKWTYYLENFMILNFPFISNGLFKIRYYVLKLLKKR